MSYNGFDPNTSLDTFRLNMSGIQPPHSYSADFISPNSIALSTYPDLVQLPSRDITVLDYEPYGYGFKIPTSASNGQLLCSFIILDDWGTDNGVLRYFENWIELIQNINEYGQPSTPIASYDHSFGYCSISFYKNKQLTNEYISTQIYPTSITPIEFSAAASGYTTFNVLFEVRNMYSNGDYSTTLNLNSSQNQTMQFLLGL